MSVEHLEVDLYEQQLLNQELQKYINRLRHQANQVTQQTIPNFQHPPTKPKSIVPTLQSSRTSSTHTNNEVLQKQNEELMQLLHDARDEIEMLRNDIIEKEDLKFESFVIPQPISTELSPPKKRKPLEWDSKFNLNVTKKAEKIEFAGDTSKPLKGFVKQRLNQFETKSVYNMKTNYFTDKPAKDLLLDPVEQLAVLINKLRAKIPSSYIPNEMDIPHDNLYHLQQILAILDAKNDDFTPRATAAPFSLNHSHFAYHIMAGGYINCFRNFKKSLTHVFCWIQPMTWQLFITASEPGVSETTKSVVYTYQIDPWKTYHSLLTCPIHEGIPIILNSLKSEGNREFLLLKPLCSPEYQVW